MEPKENLHSDPQKEVMDSEEKNESLKKEDVESKETADSNSEKSKVEKAEEKPSTKVIAEDKTEALKSEKKDIPEEVEDADASEEEDIKGKSDAPDKEAAAKKDLSVESEEQSNVETVAPEKESKVSDETVADKDEEKQAAADTDKEQLIEAESKNKKEEVAEDEIAELPEPEKSAEKEEKISEKAPEAKKEEKEHEKAEEDSSHKEPDYAAFTEVELINAFRDLLENDDFNEIQRKVENIKLNFYKKHKQKVQEQKKDFLAKGGFEEDFKAEEDPYEQDLKDLLNRYKGKKIQHSKVLEAEKEDNLKLKHKVIEEIKELVNSKESINKTFQEFKELQQRWRDIGLVPQSSLKNLWETYHHHVENFYDYIKINKELRDLDLKKNMEEKILLCEKAEALLLEPSVIKAFNALQKLHDTWRETGPVPRDQKDELWERFKEATTKINKKHQEFFENRKTAQKKNLETKTALCEKVEEILALGLSNHKEWEEKSKEIIEIQKYWRTIGFAPKKSNNAIYERFRKSCDTFFDNKREFYSKHKEIQANNLQLKIDLCVQAEALKDNTDWKKTTNEYIAIQKKWKEIGPVPRKHSDSIWKRFRTACDYFFEKKSEFFDSIDERQVENLNLKNELVAEIEKFKPSGKDQDDLEALKAFQRKWTEIGHVPFKKKDDVQKRYRDAINAQFDKLKVDDRDRNLLKFRNKVTGFINTNHGQNKMYAERDKYVSKLKGIENDLITLKNNIGFFSNSKNAEALIKDVERKIQNNEEQIAYLKDKIRIIDEMDQEDE